MEELYEFDEDSLNEEEVELDEKKKKSKRKKKERLIRIGDSVEIHYN